MIRLIVAMDQNKGIAKNGAQPWSLPEDEQYFLNKIKTHGATILRGRKEFSVYNRPIPGVRNLVASREKETIPGVEVVNDLSILDKLDDVWVIGGASIYQQTIGKASELYITHIDADFGCDLFFPEFENDFKLVSRSQPITQNGISFRFAVYKKDLQFE